MTNQKTASAQVKVSTGSEVKRICSNGIKMLIIGGGSAR
jgi:hypothetical protein